MVERRLKFCVVDNAVIGAQLTYGNVDFGIDQYGRCRWVSYPSVLFVTDDQAVAVAARDLINNAIYRNRRLLGSPARVGKGSRAKRELLLFLAEQLNNMIKEKAHATQVSSHQ